MPDRCMHCLRSEASVLVAALGFVLLVCGAQLVSDRYGGLVFMRTTFAAGAWWQLGTSQWVHFGGIHAALNVVSMLLMLWAMRGLVAGALQGAALAGGYVGVATVLVLDPACAYYAGASGALHGFWAGNAVALMLGSGATSRRHSALRWLGGAMLGALLAKFWWQYRAGFGQYPLPALESLHSYLGGMNFPVYGPAHAAGAAGGVVAVLVLVVWLCGLCQWWAPRAPKQHAAGTKH